VTYLTEARARGEKICVHGDYDVDGVTATALLVQCLERLGFETSWYLPSRFKEGYGLTCEGMERIAATGAKWVVSVDTGITAVAEVEAAHALGLKVIITDHHQAPEILPQAEAILNPNRPGCPYPNKGLSGVGVAYRLAQALCRALGQKDFGNDSEQISDLTSNKISTKSLEKNSEENTEKNSQEKIDRTLDEKINRNLEGKSQSFLKDFLGNLLPWVALGSLADNAPLNAENRALVRAGMRRLASPKGLGLRVLLRESGLDPTEFGSMDLLFKVTPLLNAAGRLGTPEHSLRLLLARTEMEAKDCFRVLGEANTERRKLDAAITEAAFAQIEEDSHLREAPCLVVASEDWHEGVIGIVASRLVEKYRRPTFVLSIDSQGWAKASGRTVHGFHLHKALSTCPELFKKWGGHYFACGFSMHKDNIPEFRSRMEKLAGEILGDELPIPEIQTDARVSLLDINADALLWLRRFEPFGPGNPSPVLVAENVGLSDNPASRPRKIAGKHLKFSIIHPQGSEPFEAIGFNMGDRLEWLQQKSRLDKLAFHPEWNRFMGRKRIQLRVIAME
jgi:single-stranded-DNA-specific exonuclease